MSVIEHAGWAFPSSWCGKSIKAALILQTFLCLDTLLCDIRIQTLLRDEGTYTLEIGWSAGLVKCRSIHRKRDMGIPKCCFDMALYTNNGISSLVATTDSSSTRSLFSNPQIIRLRYTVHHIRLFGTPSFKEQWFLGTGCTHIRLRNSDASVQFRTSERTLQYCKFQVRPLLEPQLPYSRNNRMKEFENNITSRNVK